MPTTKRKPARSPPHTPSRATPTATISTIQKGFTDAPRRPSSIVVTPSKEEATETTASPSSSTITTTHHIRNVFGTFRSVPIIPTNIQHIYRYNLSLVRNMGDSCSEDPMNGEFTIGSTQRLLQEMIQSTDFVLQQQQHDNNDNKTIHGSVLCDIGSGTGKIVFHAAALLKNVVGIGIELSKIRTRIAMQCHKHILEQDEEYGKRVQFHQGDVLNCTSLGRVTHVYAASAAFPDSVMFHLAKLWNRSLSCTQYLICNHDPKQVMDHFGFDVDDLDIKVPCRMHGSGEGKTFYFYKKSNYDERKNNDYDHATSDDETTSLLTRTELEALRSGMNRQSSLEAVTKVLNDFMEEPPTKRVRRPIQYTR